MKRLTVHFTNAPFETYVDKKTGKKKEKIFNTVAIKVKDEQSISDALDAVKRQGRKITKYYVSNIN